MLSPISTAVLIALKKQLPARYVPALAKTLVKGVVTFNTQEVAFDKIKKGRKLAPLVSPMVAGKPQKARGGVMTSVTPAYLKPTDVVIPDRILKRLPGEAIAGEMSPDQRLSAVRSDILIEQEESIERREEWMVCEVLKTGGVTLEGPDFEAVHVDYGRSAKNNVTLIGADKWENQDFATYDPMDDIEDWGDRCNVIGNFVGMGKKAWRTFKKFEAVREALDTRRGSMSTAEIGPLSNESFQWVGKIGVYNFYVYIGAFEGEDGNDELYIDEDGVMVTSSDVELYMAYGGIQDAKANASRIVETTRYPSNWYSDNPSLEWLQTQSAPVPVLLDADDVCYARV